MDSRKISNVGIAIRFAIYIALAVGALFIPAGRWDVPLFWAYLVGMTLMWIVGAAMIDRDLLVERIKPAPGGTDRALPVIVVPIALVHLIIAGLDARFGWSRVPAWLAWASLAGVLGGWAFAMWAMRVNRFFSSVVRLQSERGHLLVDAGPYQWMRHPGYAGMLVYLVCSGPALGSCWAAIPQLLTAVLIVRRLVIEERFLSSQLAGYAGYSERVRWRLVPGIW